MMNNAHSNDPTKRAMYKQGNLVLVHLNQWQNRFVQAVTSPNMVEGSPVPKKELNFTHQQQPQRKPAPPPPKGVSTKKVQALNIFNAEDPTCVAIPKEFGSAFDHIADKYVNAITSATAFDTSTRPCAVCDKTGRTFDDCPVLQHVEFLRQHYIQFKLFLKRQSAARATIN